MKIYFLALASLLIVSCKTKSKVDTNFPKDIATKPFVESKPSTITPELLANLKAEILKFGEVKCLNSGSWKYTAVGSKACGGPEFYAVYPVLREQEFLAKVNDYSAKSAQYNMETGAMSDCSIVEAPNGITCKDGKVILEYGNKIDATAVEILNIE